MADEGTAVATRARTLATYQCEPEEIAAVLGEEFGWDEERVNAWMVRFAGFITRHRLIARAELRGLVWRNATCTWKAGAEPNKIDLNDVISKDAWLIVSELMRQHVGWARTAPMDELMRAFIAASKVKDAKGSGKPGLKVAG